MTERRFLLAAFAVSVVLAVLVRISGKPYKSIPFAVMAIANIVLVLWNGRKE